MKFILHIIDKETNTYLTTWYYILICLSQNWYWTVGYEGILAILWLIKATHSGTWILIPVRLNKASKCDRVILNTQDRAYGITSLAKEDNQYVSTSMTRKDLQWFKMRWEHGFIAILLLQFKFSQNFSLLLFIFTIIVNNTSWAIIITLP